MKVYTQIQSLVDFEATICHILYSIEYSLKEWQYSIKTIIEKKEKGCRIHNLHTINLMEADSNFNNKIIAKNLLRYAKENNLLPIEQYGSRNSHRALY